MIGHALDQLHHEVRPAAVGRARIEHLGDVGMIHHRQGLPLGLEPGDHLPRVHARLDDLERDPALDRLRLLGHVDHAHAAFADLLEQLVGADLRAGLLGDGLVDGGRVVAAGPVEKRARCSWERSKCLDRGRSAAASPATGLVQIAAIAAR